VSVPHLLHLTIIALFYALVVIENGHNLHVFAYLIC